jgi:hypothetical protein
MSSNEKFEREFAAFLNEEDSRIGALYRKLPQTEPDPGLDAAVRAMAHRALNPELVATPQTDSSSRRQAARWLPALGAAAGIVLAAGIALRLGPSWHGERGETGAPTDDVINVRPIETPPAAPPPLSPAPPPPLAETVQGAAPASAPAGKLKVQSAAEAPKPAAEPSLRKNAARLDDGADNRPAGDAESGVGKAEKPAAGGAVPQAFPSPAPAQARKRAPEIDDAVERKEIMATDLHDRDVGSAARNEPAQPRADQKTAVRAKEAEAARQDEQRKAMLAAPSAAASAERAPATAPPSEQPAPPPRPAAARSSAPAPKSDANAQRAPAREEAAPPASADKAAQRKDLEKVRSTDPNSRLYPEHWLQNIRTMLRDNNRDDALRSLAEFRRMYPDYRLPDDLRDLK